MKIGLALALLLGVAALFWRHGDIHEIGLTWDEPFYFRSAERITQWTSDLLGSETRSHALDEKTIRQVWDWAHYRNPHPPFYKEAMAVTHALTSPWLGELASFRMASRVWFALLVGFAAWTAQRFWGPVAGLGAGLALLLFPRMVGHSFLGATDVAITLFWLVGTLGIFLFVTEGRKAWAFAGAVAYGFAMATKFTGFLLVAVPIAWMMLYRRRLSSFTGLVAISIAALGISIVLNPLAWHHPTEYVVALFRESLNRRAVIPINTLYFGTQYGHVVPWHQAVVMTAVTFPLPLLALSALGGAVAVRSWRTGSFAGLCVLQVLFFWAILALPSSPNHDGIRQFIPLFGFLACLAGLGFATAVRAVRERVPARGRPAAVAALAALAFVPPLFDVIRSAPFYLPHYNELVGGTRGADRLGMEITYWYEGVTSEFLREVNEALPRGARVRTFPNQDYWVSLQQYGLLRDDLDITRSIRAPYHLIYSRRGMFGSAERLLVDREEPICAVRHDGVQLVGLYRSSGEYDTGGGS